MEQNILPSQMPQMESPLPQPHGDMPMGAPMSPEMPMGAPNEMVSSEQKQELMDLIGAIRSKMGEANASRFMMGNSNASVMGDALKEVFHILQSAGVDLNNPDSVSEFLDRLRSQSPALAQQFEQIMEHLLGGDLPEASEGDEMPMLPNNMNMQYENLPEKIQGHNNSPFPEGRG